MFGKSFYEMSTDIGNGQLLEILEQWSKNCKLKDVSAGNKSKKYRFGNPFVSNLIYIEIFYTDRPIKVFGWVQTLIPFVRWQLVPSSEDSLSSKLDCRRKGGLFVSLLQNELSKRNL
jgi:hypothetical protein